MRSCECHSLRSSSADWIIHVIPIYTLALPHRRVFVIKNNLKLFFLFYSVSSQPSQHAWKTFHPMHAIWRQFWPIKFQRSKSALKLSARPMEQQKSAKLPLKWWVSAWDLITVDNAKRLHISRTIKCNALCIKREKVILNKAKSCDTRNWLIIMKIIS